MTARVSWSVDGIEPSVRERAEASARRAGMSLGDWLNSAIGSPGGTSREAQDVAEIHRRLDSIARQVEHISQVPGRPQGETGVARQLNEAISRLDARLSQISNGSTNPSYRPAPAQRMAPAVPSPAMSPMDFSIAEIVARQGELDGAPRPMPSAGRMPPPSFVNHAPPIQPQPDFSGLERQLSQITSQIETLRRPDGVEQSIAAFRGELAEIRQAITEAMPRRAIESLENEIRSLGRRIDETRSTGTDSNMLSGIERALSDIYSELRTLKPAEQLAGFDDAIRNLGGKIDMIVRSSTDPATVRQLEDAITALKGIVSNVASNEALNELAGHVQTLSIKVDQLAHAGGNNDILSALEQRIAVLTTALEQRDRPAVGDTVYFDNAVRTISDRLDNLQVGNDSSASLSHVEQRVHHLLERLEMSEPRGGNLARVEEGLSDILRHLENQRGASADQGFRASPPVDTDMVDTIKRELSDIRFSQSETNRNTQDSLEAVHNTLGHVVDRLTQIEGDLRNARSAPAARDMPPAMTEPRARETYAPEPTRAASSFAPVPRPEMPNPAAAQAPIARASVAPAPPAPPPVVQAPALAPSYEASEPAPPVAAVRPPPSPRSPIDPSLPPDHPLEPGSRVQGRTGSSPSERIAASEGVLNEISGGKQEPVSSTNFIQAARRAAQAAAAAPPAPTGAKQNRVTALNDAARSAAKAATSGDTGLSSKIRALLVGASVVVIVLGTVKMGMNLLSGHDSGNSSLPAESSVAPAPPPAPENGPRSDASPAITPSMTSPTLLTRQSPMSGPQIISVPPMPALPAAAPAEPVAAPAPTAAPVAPDVTGSIVTPQERTPAAPPAPVKDKAKVKFTPVADALPESIGSAALRSAANKGDPGAAFEIGIRYAEGRGVAQDYTTAAKWYERAGQGGIVPATFRLGTLYEKGLGLKKDVDAARRYYLDAAEKGSAKAMHNLAVLDADGGGAGPNYKSASQWFRKAAERGIADSQFNLGILYARGIGVEQNLAESFKWFSLAAAQGDADSGRKRDDVAKRLDAQSLAAAKLATQTFVAEAQPDEATASGAPASGWDTAAPAKPAAKSSAKTAAKSTAY